MRVRVIGVLGSLVSLLLAVPSPNAAAAIPGERHQCGDTIISSFKLLNNLDNCSGHGLLISGSGIVANLGGHRISGDGVGFEFGVHSGSGANVRILNGVVSNFGAGVGFFGTGGDVSDIVAINGVQVGIYVSNAKDASIRNNIVTNSFQGIQALLGDADHPVKIESNVVDGNLAGINLNSASGVVLKSNEVVGNNEIGIGLGPGSVENVISKNKVIGNGTAGAFIGSGSDENIVTGNTFQGNGFNGIAVFDSDKTQIKKNKVLANGSDGISIAGASTGNIVSGNTVVGNVGDGIVSSSAGNSIQKNAINENGANGIVLAADSAVLSNTTNGNGFLNGIDAGTGYGADVTLSTNASGNKASFNSVDAQCAPASACKVGPSTPPALLLCGAPATGGLTLRHPMDCPDDAVNVTGAGEVNLGPHWISGGTDDGDLGLSIPLGVTDVEITGGVIAATDIGIEVKGSANTLEDLVVAGNDNNAVQFRGTGSNGLSKSIIARSIGAADLVEVTEPQTTVESNLIVGGGLNGIALVSGAAQNTIASNRVFGLDVNGILLDNRDSLVFPNNNAVTKNQLIGNGVSGGTLFNADHNEFEKNIMQANGSGLVLTGNEDVPGEPLGSKDNTFVGNAVTANSEHGIVLLQESDGNVLKKNDFSANTFDGVRVVGDPLNNTVVGNTANENGANGMTFDAPDNVADLSGNEADTNGFLNDKFGDDTGLGFGAPPNTPGSGNDAEGNDDPLEGQPASLLA